MNNSNYSFQWTLLWLYKHCTFAAICFFWFHPRQNLVGKSQLEEK